MAETLRQFFAEHRPDGQVVFLGRKCAEESLIPRHPRPTGARGLREGALEEAPLWVLGLDRQAGQSQALHGHCGPGHSPACPHLAARWSRAEVRPHLRLSCGWLCSQTHLPVGSFGPLPGCPPGLGFPSSITQRPSSPVLPRGPPLRTTHTWLLPG